MPHTKEIALGALHLGGGNPLFLIAGPCVIESEAHARKMAEKVAKIASDCGVPYVFKASYDKANRSSVKAFRGPGLQGEYRVDLILFCKSRGSVRRERRLMPEHFGNIRSKRRGPHSV